METDPILKYTSLTHIGRKKKTNQDRLLSRQLENGVFLFAVIDGLGGQPGGEEAAETARTLFAEFSFSGKDYGRELPAMLQEANRAIIARGDKEPEFYNMGAAATVLLVDGRQAWWAHIGDCRLYHVHGRAVKLITEDQNLAWELYAEKKISEEQRRTHRFCGFLCQCLGEDDIEPTSGSFPVTEGDSLLLCTDGIHDLLPEEQLIAIINESDALKKRAEELKDAALQAGGDDNIGLILINIL